LIASHRVIFADTDRLVAAHEQARHDLLAERVAAGHWVGELACSALATATAVSALALVKGSGFRVQGSTDLGLLIERGIAYLDTQQNEDGGFGDTDLSHSNIATTMLVWAAFCLAGAIDHKKHRELLARAENYIEAKGNIGGLRARYGEDKTFAVPILTNCALAGLVDWKEVSPLPFELAAFPQSWYRFFRLPVVSYAIPALVAIGQARHFHRPPRNPLVRTMRRAAIGRTLKVLERMQPKSGGYLEAVPLTSFVVMSLAGTGRADHPVTRRGVQFLLDTVRPDGSWPIDTNLATWVTTLAVNALKSTAGRASSGTPRSGVVSDPVVEWLLSCQHTKRHPFTGAAPGGWGWSDLSGAVPDCDDTAGALLALANIAKRRDFAVGTDDAPGLMVRTLVAQSAGIRWLIDLQNRDGGWPTFCRGWGALPFDRSSPDLTAHALRAIHTWLPVVNDQVRTKRTRSCFDGGFRYLQKSQRPDGSWAPLWFGNQDHPNEENHVYGTSRVLLAYRDLERMSDDTAVRGVRWLVRAQNTDGGWGSASPRLKSRASSLQFAVLNTSADRGSGVEETAWAVEALCAGLDNDMLAADNSLQRAIRQGVDWLVLAVEDGRHRQPAPVGFYFAKLWYYEKLYPLVFTVAALREAASRFNPPQKHVGLADPPHPTTTRTSTTSG
jgi:squalene-hopene/tetraprenyl-beta-curcumene cyclase